MEVGNLRARSQGIDPNLTPAYQGGRRFLAPGDETLIMEVVWSLIIQGILVPGINDSNPNLPFIRLTEYGRRCVAEERFLPHDPDGYLREFQIAVPGVDTVILEYLTESLQCYVHGLNRAAAVMLGAASEQAALLLFESFAGSLSPQNGERFRSAIDKATSTYRKYEIFERHFSPVKDRLDPNLTHNLDSMIRGVFDLIRNSRNDAGHPASGVEVSRDAIYSQLRLFVPYCKRIYQLISWFSANRL